jgi:LPPG:FO 2-phospho-L-lactate transferase
MGAFTGKVVCLAGGVGGAKLAFGLARLLPPEQLTIVVNTGDDFTHLGLTICPDLDTVMYTLAGLDNQQTGWGRAGDSWRVMESVAQVGGPDWFRLGDLDLGIHLTRTHWLANGRTLTEVTRHLCQQLGIAHAILPMSDQPAPTLIESAGELLPFQDWFVRQQWQPPVTRVVLPEDVRATGAVVRAVQTADVVLIAPSNPFVSVGPILNVYPLAALLLDVPELVLAVSPIVGGQAVKGPAAKMMGEMGLPVTAAAVAAHYGELIDLFVYDVQDAEDVVVEGVTAVRLDTMMLDEYGRVRVAQQVLDAVVHYLAQ